MQKISAKRLAKSASADGHALSHVARCSACLAPHGLGRVADPLRGSRLAGGSRLRSETLSIGCICAGRGGLRAFPQHLRGDPRSNAEFAA